MIAREDHAHVSSTQGLSIFSVQDNKTKKTCAITSASNLTDLRQEINNEPDTIIVSCKAYDNEYAAMDLETFIHDRKRTKIVLLQNGVGNEEVFYEYFDPSMIYRISTSEGALLLTPGKILHAGSGITFIGQPSKIGTDKFSFELASLLTDSGIESMAVRDINKKIWTKILINAPINPVATIHKVKNGELVRRPKLKYLMERIIEETLSVFKRRKIEIEQRVDPYTTVFSVAEKTAENKCSMLQDIEKGHQTEIDFLNGRIIREANQEKLDVPYNFSMYNRIKQIEFGLNYNRPQVTLY